MGIKARIRQIGKVGRICCSILLVVSGLALFTWVIGGITGFVKLTNAPSVSIGEWSYSGGVTVSNLIITAVWAIWAIGPWLMRRIFVQFTRDEIFTSSTARLIKWLGVWNLVQFFCLNPSFLLIGLFLLALGWCMELAVSLKQEQDLTI